MYDVNWTSPINWSHPLNKGRRAWWLVTPQWRGSVFRDLCGKLPATFSSGMAPASAWTADGLTFDGTNDDCLTDAAPGFSGPPVTVYAWFKPSALSNYDGVIGAENFHPTLLCATASGNRMSYQWEGTSDEYDGGSGLSLATGELHFGAVSITATAATIYLWRESTGLLSLTNTKTHNTYSIGRLRIGSDRGGTLSDHFFSGRIYDAGLFDRALTESHVRKYIRLSRSGYGSLLNHRRNRLAGVSAAAAVAARRRLVMMGM